MRVRNIEGATGLTCGCESWIDHWCRQTGKVRPVFCRAELCLGTDPVGAHVRRAWNGDRAWYIVPLCRDHNELDTVVDVGTSCLALAGLARTCRNKQTA
jgi:hypothetical protein